MTSTDISCTVYYAHNFIDTICDSDVTDVIEQLLKTSNKFVTFDGLPGQLKGCYHICYKRADVASEYYE